MLNLAVMILNSSVVAARMVTAAKSTKSKKEKTACPFHFQKVAGALASLI